MKSPPGVLWDTFRSPEMDLSCVVSILSLNLFYSFLKPFREGLMVLSRSDTPKPVERRSRVTTEVERRCSVVGNRLI